MMKGIRLSYTGNVIPSPKQIRLPGSKSISNRALLLQFLNGHPRQILNLSDSDDTLVLQECLRQISTSESADEEIRTIDAGHAGTAFRFLTALLAFRPGNWLLKGSARMHQRPIGPLVDSLRSLGAKISYQGAEGYPPLLITGTSPGKFQPQIDISQSSQFASALLMVMASLRRHSSLTLTGNAVSMPYLDMSIAVMNETGMNVQREGMQVLIREQLPEAEQFEVEADWSSAAFFYQLCALLPGSAYRMDGLKENSVQGDAVLAELYIPLGVETKFDKDGINIRNTGLLSSEPYCRNLSDTPDLLPALACTCAGLGLEANFSGVAHLKIKESDRLSALAAELVKLGLDTTIEADSMHIKGKAGYSAQALETWGDHRLAMALAALAPVCKDVSILNPEVVSKSFPGFWLELLSTGLFTEQYI